MIDRYNMVITTKGKAIQYHFLYVLSWPFYQAYNNQNKEYNLTIYLVGELVITIADITMTQHIYTMATTASLRISNTGT